MFCEIQKETEYDKFWNSKGEYGKERVKRKNERKSARTKRRKEISDSRKTYHCRECGEDPYCYCGDGTPYSY